MKELVVIDNGVEVDWYDPIDEDEVKEDDDCYIFSNGYHTYVVEKRPYREVVIREKVQE